jgi:hypothetical protein
VFVKAAGNSPSASKSSGSKSINSISPLASENRCKSFLLNICSSVKGHFLPRDHRLQGLDARTEKMIIKAKLRADSFTLY